MSAVNRGSDTGSTGSAASQAWSLPEPSPEYEEAEDRAENATCSASSPSSWSVRSRSPPEAGHDTTFREERKGLGERRRGSTISGVRTARPDTACPPQPS